MTKEEAKKLIDAVNTHNGGIFVCAHAKTDCDHVYLFTASELNKEQELWTEKDKQKDFNFNKYPYWLLSGDEYKPIGIRTYLDLVPFDLTKSEFNFLKKI
jgi:hypothetical protein